MNTILGYYIDWNEQIMSPIFFSREEAEKFREENYGEKPSKDYHIYEILDIEIDTNSLKRYLSEIVTNQLITD